MTVLDEILGYPAFALVRRQGADTVTLLGGERRDVEELSDIALDAGPTPTGGPFDRLLCVPFGQIRERGFEVHDDGTPLTGIEIQRQAEIAVPELVALLPDQPIKSAGSSGFDIDDDDYADIVRHVIDDEIGNGEGANVVVARNYRATLADWGVDKALTVLRRLLERERGAYWTFLVFTGDRYLIGASPERHISVHGGDVRMNPISGTFRVQGSGAGEQRKARLLDFLADEKEIYELFMVVDEELKMMCDICNEGGQVLGPYLKAMTHLIHTEYILAGRTSKDLRDVLRASMFAATVTGSPVENACRVIKKYEHQGRGYYGAMMVLLGHDDDGSQTADAPILLRTADVSLDGRLRVTAGATLVRDSEPRHEVAETHAKAGGILTAFGLVEAPSTTPGEVAELASDEDVLVALGRRNQRLSPFWLNDQSDTEESPVLVGRHVVILDGEDDFITMLRHLLAVLGMSSATVRHYDYAPGAFDAADVVVVGPGPGDPRDLCDPKIKAVRAAVDELLQTGKPFLAVCLGHQVLCGALGIALDFKDIVFQGTQTRVGILGRTEHVGFYNTFVARVADDEVAGLPEGVTVDREAGSGDVHLVSGPHYHGVQFHAESILTQRGFELVRELMLNLVAQRA